MTTDDASIVTWASLLEIWDSSDDPEDKVGAIMALVGAARDSQKATCIYAAIQKPNWVPYLTALFNFSAAMEEANK